MELEITPEPEPDEREAVAVALAGGLDPPEPYRSEWRRAGTDEALVPFET